MKPELTLLTDQERKAHKETLWEKTRGRGRKRRETIRWGWGWGVGLLLKQRELEKDKKMSKKIEGRKGQKQKDGLQYLYIGKDDIVVILYEKNVLWLLLIQISNHPDVLQTSDHDLGMEPEHATESDIAFAYFHTSTMLLLVIYDWRRRISLFLENSCVTVCAVRVIFW